MLCRSSRKDIGKGIYVSFRAIHGQELKKKNTCTYGLFWRYHNPEVKVISASASTTNNYMYIRGPQQTPSAGIHTCIFKTINPTPLLGAVLG